MKAVAAANYEASPSPMHASYREKRRIRTLFKSLPTLLTNAIESMQNMRNLIRIHPTDRSIIHICNLQ